MKEDDICQGHPNGGTLPLTHCQTPTGGRGFLLDPLLLSGWVMGDGWMDEEMDDDWMDG